MRSARRTSPGRAACSSRVNWRFVAPVYIPDEVVSRIEVLEVRHDKPIAKLKQTVTRSDGQVVLDGEVLTYMSPRKSLLAAAEAAATSSGSGQA